jgi:hypothetical protein
MIIAAVGGAVFFATNRSQQGEFDGQWLLDRRHHYLTVFILIL